MREFRLEREARTLDPVPLQLFELHQRDVGAAAPFNLHPTAAYGNERSSSLAGKRAANLLAAHLQTDQRDRKTCETDAKASGRWSETNGNGPEERADYRLA
jgi:hypothetical protein